MWLLFVFVLIFQPSIVSAHPGSLDGNGCHYCTNCTKYGDLYQWEGKLYEYYHCGYDLIPPSSSNTSSEEPSIGDLLNKIITPTDYLPPPVPTIPDNNYDPFLGLSASTSTPTHIPFATWTPRPTPTPRPTYKPLKSYVEIVVSITPTLTPTKTPFITPIDSSEVEHSESTSINDYIFYGSILTILFGTSYVVFSAVNQIGPFRAK